MTTCELRLKAAEIIEQRGWCQGQLTKGGAVCAAGALRIAASGETHAVQPNVYWEARSELCLEIGGDLLRWNDYEGRTQAEVLARLRDGCEPVKASAESAS